MPPSNKQKFHPLPAPGDFVWCHYPVSIGKPGPKPRPALVVRVAPSSHEVAVAYGTSQKAYPPKVYPTEFVLDPSDPGFQTSGLSLRTKFDVNTLVQLPFNNEWFGAAPGLAGHIPLPRLGALHACYMVALQAAIKNRT